MRTTTGKLIVAALVLLPLVTGCANQNLTRLRRENAQLRHDMRELQREMASMDDVSPVTAAPLARIRSFTVGLAASAKSFEESAFEQLLNAALAKSAQNNDFRVVREQDARESDKVQGMLLHQYLAAEEIPITISNLSYKLTAPDHEFLLGERAVPKSATQIARASGGGTVHVTAEGPVSSIMRRDAKGTYSISYEEVGGGKGSIRLNLADVEIFTSNDRPHSARQGDISFNWKLNLERLQVYRVENFQGDVGRFLRTMRYPGQEAQSISQYQTLRDSVFLFGYGNYFTSLVQQIKTPRIVTAVEVMPLDAALFERLEPGMDEGEILDAVGMLTEWLPCAFVEFADNEKVWSRPPTVGFPFLSRQVWGEKKLVFYSKYNAGGQPILLGDFERE